MKAKYKITVSENHCVIDIQKITFTISLQSGQEIDIGAAAWNFEQYAKLLRKLDDRLYYEKQASEF